jgi:hypothetical protein
MCRLYANTLPFHARFEHLLVLVLEPVPTDTGTSVLSA